MGNPHKGEVTFAAQGRNWTLRYGINEICILERALEMPIGAIAVALANPARLSMVHFRTLFRGGLYGEHPELTDDAVGELINEISFAVALAKFTEAFSIAFPQGGKATGARPPQTPAPALPNRRARRKAQSQKKAGTGRRS